ncbi:MAG: hypothetical protein IVW57_12640 [Ktedonobacterales bacterium]|nr:hypothetical protein [Ktedonobacterales bacterium]
MPSSSRRRPPPRGTRSWKRIGALLGLALTVLLALIVVHAQGQRDTRTPPPATTQGTTDIVPIPTTTKTPTKTPTPVSTPQVISPSLPPVTIYVAPPPKPTIHVARVLAAAVPITSGAICGPTDARSFKISALITVTNPIGGVVTYHWRSSDGFISVPLKATFKPGQTTQLVSDVWTLGAGNANGLRRWEEAVVTSPTATTSNQAAFVYSCPAIVSGLVVRATRTTPDCATVQPGYDVTAIATIFAPAGGSVTFQWRHTKDSGTYTQAQTVVVPVGVIEEQVIAHWHIGGGTSNEQLPEGVTMATATGQTLTTPVIQQTGSGNGSGTPTPTASPTPVCPSPTPTPLPTVDGITLNAASAVPNILTYDCANSSQPQTYTFSGQVSLAATASGTLTYHWVRPDGTLGPDQTLAVNAGDTLLQVPPDDAWTQAPNPTDGAYHERIVITGINTTTLTTPFTSIYGQYAVLCAPPQP